ncbi:hypothetical protein ACTXQV_74805, partial [Klebsiella pneumoniae]
VRENPWTGVGIGDAVGFASDTTRNLAEVADAALDALDQVTSHTKRGVVGMTNLAAGTVRDMCD